VVAEAVVVVDTEADVMEAGKLIQIPSLEHTTNKAKLLWRWRRRIPGR